MCFMRGVRACLMHLSVRSLASPAGPADRFCNLLLTISYKEQQNMCMWRKASLSLCMAACCPHVFKIDHHAMYICSSALLLIALYVWTHVFACIGWTVTCTCVCLCVSTVGAGRSRARMWMHVWSGGHLKHTHTTTRMSPQGRRKEENLTLNICCINVVMYSFFFLVLD